MFRLAPRIAQNKLPACLKIGRKTVVTSTVDWKPIKSSKTPNDEHQKKPFARKIFLGLMIAMPVVSFYLGTWQMRRLKWKTNLIAVCEDRLTYPAVPLPRSFEPEMADNWEYRKVLLKGEFMHDEELFVGPRVRNGIKGYLLFTPMVLQDSGRKVLVERGWISEEKVLPSSRRLRRLSLPPGKNVEVECIVRVPKKRGTFQWDKLDTESRVWQVIDIGEMAAATGSMPVHLQAMYDLHDHTWNSPEDASLATAASNEKPFWNFWSKSSPSTSVRESENESAQNRDDSNEFNEFQLIKYGVPIGKVPKIDFKNNHLQYLVTWYGLSFLSSIFLVVALRRGKSSAVSQGQLKRDKLRHARKNM